MFVLPRRQGAPWMKRPPASLPRHGPVNLAMAKRSAWVSSSTSLPVQACSWVKLRKATHTSPWVSPSWRLPFLERLAWVFSAAADSTAYLTMPEQSRQSCLRSEAGTPICDSTARASGQLLQQRALRELLLWRGRGQSSWRATSLAFTACVGLAFTCSETVGSREAR
jgi:hypothetical protein